MTDQATPPLVALVPMRHHSERVPEKNLRDLAGKPLYQYILRTLKSVPAISRIVVNTDSPTLKEGIEKHFPEVFIIDRPAHLCGGDTPMNEILAYDVAHVEGDFFIQTHSTNPLLKAGSVERAIDTYFDSLPEFDSLFGVTRRQIRIWDKQGKPLNHDPQELIRTQDLEPFFEENSCVYMFDRSTMLERGNRIGAFPQMFEIPPLEAIDIDTMFDFELVEHILQAGLDVK